MNSHSLQPASDYTIPQLADLLTRGFEGYYIPIDVTESVLLSMLRRDGVSLEDSRVILSKGEPVGAALVARRGWTSRIDAMGLVTGARNRGIGTWAMKRLIEEARERGDREMILEVIEQNRAGVRLYEKVHFQVVRRLVGFKIERPRVHVEAELEEVDIRELAQLVTSFGLKDLPWQVSGETLAHHTPPARAYRLGDAFCLTGNLNPADVVIWSVLVLPQARGQLRGARLVQALFANNPGKIWHVPALCPEELGFVFEKAGMQRERLSQLQMRLSL